MKKVNVGIIGCGKISDIYLKNLTGIFSELIYVKAVADLVAECAQARAAKYSIPEVMSVEEMIHSDSIDIIINLTTPGAHYSICEMALQNSKNVYTEKPLCLTYEDGKKLVDLAKRKGLLIGCAPDTFLGAGLQASQKLIENGTIGKPLAATAFMVCHGWEEHHPNPDFYYLKGGGPMFDMGPYYISALVSFLGPAVSVCSMIGKSFEKRTVLTGPRLGEIIPVEVPTHITGTIQFQNGAIATVITSFDLWDTQMPFMQVYGTLGTLIAPDPNTFSGPVLLRTPKQNCPLNLPIPDVYQENSRGLGVYEMASALLNDRKPRANGEFALHVLEIMEAFHRSGTEKQFIRLQSTCCQPPVFIP